MKKPTLLAIAGLCAAVACIVPASAAVYGVHDHYYAVFNHESGPHQVTTVPEPGTFALLTLGLAGLGLAPLRRRRKD